MADESVISIRGLVEGGGSPLRKFRGKFDSYVPGPASGYEGTRVDLNFTEVEVIQSVEPYAFPIATINVGLNNKKKTKWGYFAESMANLIPEGEDIKDQIGKVMVLVFADGKDDRPSPESFKIWNRDEAAKWRQAQDYEDKILSLEKSGGKEDKVAELKGLLDSLGVVHSEGMVPTPVWLVEEVEGVSAAGKGKSVTDIAEELLDGKTLAQFNQAVLQKTEVQKDTEFQKSILDKSFVKAAVAAGKFTIDKNSVYHKKAA